MRKSLRRIPDMRIVLAVDADTAQAFCDYFEPRYHSNRTGKFYAIKIASNGQEALALFPPLTPIVVGEYLPDMTRQEFLLKLADKLDQEWVRWIDFIFVNEKDTAGETIPAFVERRWNVVKPLDFGELEKIFGTIQQGRHSDWKNPVTHLPSGHLIGNRLKELVNQQGWTLLYIVIEGMDAFGDQYGWSASDTVTRFAADVIEEVIDECSASTDFVGHIGGGDFVVIVPPEKVEVVIQQLQARFASGVQQRYPSTLASVASSHRATSALHRLQPRSKEAADGPAVPPLNLAIGIIRSTDGPFANINEIEDKASASLRR
ncbi:hypothetical protein TFLX_01458 [Thermoflexales bacterium]|nr:hypothetical protein TFLX_01458 [Thermoflexales bacterium]